ncbi:hypothetical protein [Moraxella bovoculi]|uniref:hypothetical protein n=1 Tax=Moraxella bovoculi TaxID=386891 RepID=UPI000624D20D|nr:hypothetical protein [Moraxella bovoculi]
MTTGLKVWDRDGKQIFLSKKNNLKMVGRQQVAYNPSLLGVIHHIKYDVPSNANRVFCVSCLPSSDDVFNTLPAYVWDENDGVAWSYLDDGNPKASCIIYYGYI